MKYVARKISPAKWRSKADMETEDISADAVTGCLRTSRNTLSVWQCTLDEADVAEVILALGSEMERLDTINVVLIEKSSLEEEGLALEATLGKTPVEDLRSRHMDIVNLNMTKLCFLAREIAPKVRNNSDCYRFKATRVRQLIVEAIQNGRLELDSLKEKVRVEVEKRL